jgi:tRNA(Glu) U13 pseudouridine synthase TruD
VFNAVLDARVAAGLVHRLRPGDVACLRSGAPFTVATADLDDVNRRAAPGLLEVMATGPMPGTWRIQPAEDVLAEEHAWSATTGIDWAWFQDRACFASPGGRRTLVVPFRAPARVEVAGQVTWVELSLPAGAFATEALTQVGITLPADRRG